MVSIRLRGLVTPLHFGRLEKRIRENHPDQNPYEQGHDPRMVESLKRLATDESLDEGVRETFGSSELLENPFAHEFVTLDNLARDSFDVLKRIWGTNENNRVVGANTLAHIALFLIPENHIPKKDYWGPHSYSENWISTQMEWWAGLIEKAVGVYEFKFAGGEKEPLLHPIPHWTRDMINSHYLPGKDKRRYDPRLTGEKRKGIPHITMGYFMHEMVRASEALAEESGVALTEHDREVNYGYFKEIMQRAGYHFPDSREEMEGIASEVDYKLARKNSKVSELTNRLFRLNLREDHGLTLPTIEEFLRPKSKEVLRKVAPLYNFQQYGNQPTRLSA